MDRKAWELPLDQKTIAQYMKEQGYVTGVIGKWNAANVKSLWPAKVDAP